MNQPDNSRNSVSVNSGGTPYLTQADNEFHSWNMDEPQELGGQDQAPSPKEILLSALGGCTAITLRMYAERKGWQVDNVEVKLSIVSERDESGAYHSQIKRQIFITGGLDEAERARMLKIAEACPIHRTLVGEISIDTEVA